jgi:hypothetical protein
MWQGGTDLQATNWWIYFDGTAFEATGTSLSWWAELLVAGCSKCDPVSPTCCIPQQPVANNFPNPNAGDNVFAELWFGDLNCNMAVTENDNTQTVAYYIGNYTQNVYMEQCYLASNVLSSQSPPRQGPSGITGGSAEWILESHPGSNPLASFPTTLMFDPLVFDPANEWSLYSAMPGWFSSTPDSFSMVESNGHTLATSASLDLGSEIQFTWVNYQ